MESLVHLAEGFATALTPYHLLWCMIGVMLGTTVGILPGLGPGATIAMLLPTTIYQEPTASLIMLTGIYYGAQYGGSTTSILLNIPGETSSVCTCIDGYPMAQQGRAGTALAIAAIGSFIAGTIALGFVVMAASALADLGLAFGPAEQFMLMAMALVVAGSFGESIIRGMVSACFGLLISFVGADPISGINRFVFGIDYMYEGFQIVSVIVGMFAVGEVFTYIGGLGEGDIKNLPKVSFRSLFPRITELTVCAWSVLRGSLIGFWVGIMPGTGPSTSTFISYAVEKRLSKHPEKFGKGAIEGVASPESANNAASIGAMLPMFTLGIPGSGAAAIMMAGLVMWGLQPGPMLITDRPDCFWPVIASLYIANVVLLAVNLPGAMILAQVSRVPTRLMMPFVLGISLTGVYATSGSMFGPIQAIFFGFVAYLFRRAKYPLASVALGVVLGRMVEQNLRRSLIIFHGNWFLFFTRPLCLMIMALTAVLLTMSIMLYRIAKRRGIV